jgi:glutamate 5-kinase
MNHREIKSQILARTRRIVVKLGSSVLATPSGVSTEQIGRISAELCALAAEGYQIVVVTSGARAAGLARLGLTRIPKKIPEQQAAAAIGQIRLMALYERYFSDFGRHVGQVLLTADDLRDRTRYLNAQRTFDHLLRHQVVPIVNENDSVAVDELKFGDNDRLSALVAGLVGADLLVILTDVDGLYAGDPRAGDVPLIELVDDVDSHIDSGVAGGVGSAVGTGGMASKLVAARTAAHRGIPTVVASGMIAGTLARIIDPDDHAGTLFLPRQLPMRSRKHWIAHGLPVRGTLVLDAGALGALTRKGSSLLPAGIAEIRGEFARGDCVSCVDLSGREFARGLAAYDSDECRQIRGEASSRIDSILGYHDGDEVIHRDDLAILAELGAEPGETLGEAAELLAGVKEAR